MSGGLIVSRDLELLAPKFRIAVQAAVAECRAAGLDAWVFEAYRSQELQALYYARGRTVIPPPRTVTNAPTNLPELARLRSRRSTWSRRSTSGSTLSRRAHLPLQRLGPVEHEVVARDVRLVGVLEADEEASVRQQAPVGDPELLEVEDLGGRRDRELGPLS